MAIKSIRVLALMQFPNDKTIRLWDGAGPYLDPDGEIWTGSAINEGLDQIESALNGEASTLTLGLSTLDPRIAELAFEDLQDGNVIGGKVQILIQPCDMWDQPVGGAEVRFTGTIDNMPMDDTVSGDQIVSTVTLEITNRFDLRTLVSGAVLSDVDQRARAAILNPGAPADRFAERISAPRSRRLSGMSGAAQTRNISDYLPITANMAEGGDWSVVDVRFTSARPPCVSRNGTGTASLVEDANEPTGLGYRYQFQSSATFGWIGFTIPQCNGGFISAAFAAYCPDGIASILVDRGGDTVNSFGDPAYYDLGDVAPWS
ncbi:hypothetical protein [Pelagibacterium lacus]|uniref:hypothetical protein n=1 Tax=Pelagibacterium lacus TaxID=2282655 RepID=UPI0018F3C8B0|nr:hypothetical protein [Pelagibacterium lacus]